VASRVAVVSVAIAVVAAAVSGLLYYQATREGEAVRRLGVEVAGVSMARLGRSQAAISLLGLGIPTPRTTIPRRSGSAATPYT
jgi:uncharacterized membrane protein